MHTRRWRFVFSCMLLAACAMGIVQCANPTPTVPATPSHASTPTHTPTPSSTASNTASAPASFTPSSTPFPAPTAAPLAVNTSTPPPTATEEAKTDPVIHYFRASVEQADPGDTIVLEWESSGGTAAVLYHIPPSGQLPPSGWEVATSGVYTYEISSDAFNVSEFFLYVTDETERGAGANLAVRLRCLVPWFFSPPPDVCASDPIHSEAAEQQFERGVMIWIEETDNIFVLYGDELSSPKWEMFSDEWDAGEPDHDPTLTPPAGMYQPVRGFGLVWREHQVRDRLGWAVDPETGFGTIMQGTTLFKYNSIYVRALDGNVWHLGPERSSWVKVLVIE